jgi:hypothetical protein
MTRLEAINLIKEYYNEPIWCVTIGIGSPQVQGVEFEEAVAEFDRCNIKFNTEYLEYVYMYPKDYVNQRQELHDALAILGLGYARRKRELTKGERNE